MPLHRHRATCTSEVGEEVRLFEDGSRVGEVVFRASSLVGPSEDALGWIGYALGDVDFALIAIDPERYAEVSPSVRRWGGPTGVADPLEMSRGDTLRVYGHGAVVRETSQHAREGVLVDRDSQMFEFAMPISGGDSGSPIIHAATGQALGHVHGFHNGPTLMRALAVAAESGFDVELVTAPLAQEDVLVSDDLHAPYVLEPSGVDASANGPPLSFDDSATTPAGVAVSIAAPANDADPDGDPLTVTSEYSASSESAEFEVGGATSSGDLLIGAPVSFSVVD